MGDKIGDSNHTKKYCWPDVAMHICLLGSQAGRQAGKALSFNLFGQNTKHKQEVILPRNKFTRLGKMVLSQADPNWKWS